VRLVYLRVYDNRDICHQSVPSPSLCYPLTHTHRSIGYHNRNPQPLTDSTTRLMYLRVYDNRDSSNQSTPSPSLWYSLTHAQNTPPTTTLLTITYTQVLRFLECLTSPTVSCYVTTRTRPRGTSHDRFGSDSDPSLNGHLHYPNGIDKSLNEASADKIRKYHTDYTNNPPIKVSFMSVIPSTSGRLHSDFINIDPQGNQCMWDE
jgi:hypothetical protein